MVNNNTVSVAPYNGAERRQMPAQMGRACGTERRRFCAPQKGVLNGNFMGIEKGRFLEDRESLAAIVDCMPPADKAEYLSFKALEILAGFPHRQLVVYTLRDGAPEGVQTMRLGGLQVQDYGGPSVEAVVDGLSFQINVYPSKPFKDRDLFLQIPQRFEFKWKGKVADNGGVQFAPHYAILTKTRSKEFHQVEGHTYCVTLNQFRERFPKVPIRY